MLQPGDEVFTAIIFLACEAVIYGLIALYLLAVIPSEFGGRQPWHFPVTDIIKWYKRRQYRKIHHGDSQTSIDPFSETQQALAIKIDENETKYEDSDVKFERQRVLETKFDAKDYPLVIRNMRKIYTGRGGLGPKLAVKDVTLAAEKDLILGLLGPNGAGKTTLISILTGLYAPSSGSAELGGFDVKREQEGIYKIMGICPQVR
jgi:ABC-type glutathione transport system ATPase component